MRVILNENILGHEHTKPELCLLPENEHDQELLKRLVDRYDVHFGRQVDGKVLHVAMLLEER